MTLTGNQIPYVLITPARNEAGYIGKTIESMIRQTFPPAKWVIVDDGSLDDTAEIVSKYLKDYHWIELVRLPKHRDRSFAGKVYAFNSGRAKAQSVSYGIIGNLDADVSFEPDYFEFLTSKFQQDPSLGVAGTVFVEADGYSSETDSFEGRNHVSGQVQLFRRECFEQIGGYVPHRAGGIDWMAVTTARMIGWKTRSYREKHFFHYRRLGTAERGLHASLFSYGEKDYYLGGHPVWEICRVAYRMVKKPYVTGAIALGAGYIRAYVSRTPRPVSAQLMQFHRREQMAKLKAIVNTKLRFRRVDNFDIAAS